MSGLVLKLAAGERFIVNGALLENGDKPSTVRVVDDARILDVRRGGLGPGVHHLMALWYLPLITLHLERRPPHMPANEPHR